MATPEAPKIPEKVTLKPGQSGTPEQVKEQERSFMDKMRLTFGLTTESRLLLEKQVDRAQNKQEALNKIAAKLLKEANAEGKAKDMTFVTFAEKYGVRNPIAMNAAQITFSVLSELSPDAAMNQKAIDLAKGEMLKPKEEVKPSAPSELIAAKPAKKPIQGRVAIARRTKR